MKHGAKILFFLILMFSLGTAQNFSVLKQSVEKLESRIAYLQQSAERYRIQRAEDYLTQASAKLDEARSLIRQIPPRVNSAWAAYREAKALTDLAEKALVVKPALRAGAEMDRLLLQAESLIQNSNNAEARYMLTRARSFRFKSETAFRNSRFVKAREYYRIALFFVNKSIQLAQGKAGINTGQSYRHLLEDITNLYNELSTDSGSDAALNKLLQKVQRTLDLARKAYEQGNRRQALLQLQISERLLYRAADISQQSGRGQTERLDSNLSLLEQYIMGIEAELGNNKNRESKRLLRKAKEFLKAARYDYGNNALKKAESKMALARRMATKALRLSDRNAQDAANETEQRIREIRHLIQLQKEKGNSSQKPIMRVFHGQAQRLLDAAEKDFLSGHTQIAFRKTKTALHLVNRVEAVLSAPPAATQTSSQLQERLRQVKRSILILRENTNPGSESAVLVPLLQNLSEKIQTAINNGNLVMAGEILDFIQSRINNLMKTEVH